MIGNLRLKPDDPNAVYGDALEVDCHLSYKLLDMLAKVVTLKIYNNEGFFNNESTVNYSSYVVMNTSRIQYTLDLLSTKKFLPNLPVEGILFLDQRKHAIPCDFSPGM